MLDSLLPMPKINTMPLLALGDLMAQLNSSMMCLRQCYAIMVSYLRPVMEQPLILSHLINHASPILSNELSNTYLISVWLLWNSSLFNLLYFIIVWSCGHYYKV